MQPGSGSGRNHPGRNRSRLTSQRDALRRLSHDLRGSCANLRMGLQASQANPELFSALAPSMSQEVESLDRRLQQLSWLGRAPFPQLQDASPRRCIERWSPSGTALELQDFEASFDIDLVEAAFDQLVANAQSHGQGLKRVSLCQAPENWTLSLEDHGPGWPEGLPEWLQQTGWRLWQGQPALGLSLASAVATGHRGSLKLIHSNEGGAIAQMIFPRGDR